MNKWSLSPALLLVMWIDRSQHEADVTLRPGDWRTL